MTKAFWQILILFSMLKEVYHTARTLIRLLVLGVLLLLPASALLADRIYLKNGQVLRGNILSIELNGYKFEQDGGPIQNIAKGRVERIQFGLESETGHAGGFLLRLLLGSGLAQYDEQMEATDESIDASHIFLRTAFIPSWQLGASNWIVHWGIEYNHSSLLESRDFEYSYLAWSGGFSYYPGFLGLYINPELRLVQSGSVSFQLERFDDRASADLQGDEFGFGIRLGTERRISERYFIWSLALSYTEDNLNVERTGLLTGATNPAKVRYLGLDFTLTIEELF